MSPDIFTTAKILIKSLTLIGFLVYIIFAWVIVRQEKLMAGVLEEEFEPLVRLATYIHLTGAIAIFVLALIILP